MMGWTRAFAMKCKYFDGVAKIDMGHVYIDGSPAWVLWALDDFRSPICKPTVCLIDYDIPPPAPGFAIIYNAGANEGIYPGLLAAGIIGEAIEWYDVGFNLKGAALCPILAPELPK